MSTHIVEFEDYLEHEVRDVVQEHFPLDWKEDSITHALLIRLRKRFQRVSLRGLRYPLELEWEIYKLHGPSESKYGDIGILIRYCMPSGAVLEGAGFLEAKVRARGASRFPAARPGQFARILSRSPQTRLLLYDYNPVTVLDPATEPDRSWHFYPSRCHRVPADCAPVSHAVVLPLQLAVAVNQYDDTLYRFTHAFSYQFSQRYIHLHDLDFSKGAVDAVKGFPSGLGMDSRRPNVIMVLRFAPPGQELPEPFHPDANRYSTLE